MNTNNIELLNAFVGQRAGLSYADYGDPTAFKQEQRDIARHKKIYNDLLQFALMYVDDLNNQIEIELGKGGRLELINGKLEYTTGQYFPTEYRPAAIRILRECILSEYWRRNPDGGSIKNLMDYVKRCVNRSTYNWIFG